MLHRDYNTTSRKMIARITILVTLSVVAIALWADIIRAEINKKPVWEASYPMANQHIEWTYAGKDGAGK